MGGVTEADVGFPTGTQHDNRELSKQYYYDNIWDLIFQAAFKQLHNLYVCYIC